MNNLNIGTTKLDGGGPSRSKHSQSQASANASDKKLQRQTLFWWQAYPNSLFALLAVTK